MIQSRSTKFVAISCMVVLSACSSVRVEPLAASNNAIVGSYPYSLARTSLTLTISVSLTSCGAVQAGPPRIVDNKKVYDFRPVLGLAEPIAVVPTFEGDPSQVYDVPYDQLRRVFGKETKITVTRNANGTLSGINGTVNDQYGPGAVAAVEAAVKVAAGIMIPPVGVAETVTTLAKGGLMGAGSGHGLRKKKTIYHKPPSFCTDAVMTALSEIDAKSQDAAAQAAKDAKDNVTVASPNIAKDQTEIARLQAENRLTKTVRLVWTPAGDEKPDAVGNGYAILRRSVDLYRGAIHDWLSPAGQEWFDETIKPTKIPAIPLSEPARMAALAVTQPIMMQLEMRQFTMGGALPHGDAKKIDEANPTQEQPAGIVIRDPAQGFVRLCHGACSIPGPGIQETGGEIAAPAAVAMGQFGRMVVVHLKNRIFENSEFSVSVNADGSIASIGNHTSGTLAAGLGTLGDTGTAAVTDAAAYNTALAAKNTNTVNRSALVDTVNKNLADCYTQQEAVRKAGGVPIGTCGLKIVTMRRFSTVLVLAAILWATSARAAENSPKYGDIVVVWKRVETSTDPATISNEVAHALPAWATTKVAGAVTSFVAKLYKLDPKVFPQQVTAIADKVASLNGIAPGGSLAANQGVTVPFVAGVLPGRTSHIPFLSDDQRTVEQVQKSVGPKLNQFIKYLGKATSGFSIAIRKMSIGQAMRELAADPSLQILSAPLKLKEAAGGGWVPWSLTTGDIASIQKVAALPTQQHPVVIVADSVSPDQSSELEARSFVLNEVAEMRSKIGLPPIRLYDAQCGLGLADPQWKAPPLDGGHPVHSVEIKASLRPLVAAVANGTSPQVIYLPLLRGSRCETETIRQIVEFHQLVSALKGDIAKSSQPGIVDSYRKRTTDTVGAVGTSVKDGFMDTNVGVVDAVLFFGSTYAEDHGNPVFTSMSWTFDPSSFNPQPPENSGGLYVVSAGNEGRSPTVEADGFQFPARSIKGSDTLAVMNADADGKLLCKSSVVTHSAHAFMTSFNGAIPGDCGTSFAAPRVAWLLALREAVRPAQAIPSRLAASLRKDALVAGTVRSEGGGSVLDLTTLFRDQLSSAAMPPAPPPSPLPLTTPLPVPPDPISPQQH